MYWANFLHVYQPPTQKSIWVKRVADECYRKLFGGLLNIPNARLTLNINSVLCELLERDGASDVIKSIKELVDRGNIELTGSAKFHAFLPLLPESEIKRQILLNEEGLNKYFGKGWKKGGFFSPEMAYSKKVAKVAVSLGYKWIIIDEMAFPPEKKLEKNKIYDITGIEDFSVFFRERNFSFKILSASQISTLPTIMRFLAPRFDKDEYTITAMDGETFGHHRPGLENLLFDLLKKEEIKSIAIGDIFNYFKNHVKIEPRESTWASLPRDFKNNEPFSRWNNKDNQIQNYQWRLTNLAIEIIGRDEKDKARDVLDESLHSDQYWWSSAKPWWSLEMIERGAYDLKRVVLSAKKSTQEEKNEAEELYKKILFTGFEWQRSGFVDELSRAENEEVQERLEEKEKLFVTKDEYEDLIKTLTEQMHQSAESEEYHRASMLKDRIRELGEEMNKMEKNIKPESNPNGTGDLMF